MRQEQLQLGQTNLQYKQPTIYFRRDPLSPADQRDLEAYAEVLRAYYGIPKGHAVFPPRTRATRTGAAKGAGKRPTPRATGTNRADHPWRGTL